ncbi:hypothetical protein F0562_004357 [Nyssa sinensis]|uniref:U1-type domain-containing protein n=1 Tax=Nyssa sinensis TaxID=561372 RepID=A0A5J5BYB0_9ASTE|nr:hypothetical protein F0562_004357 [Nyssa sinensis]
MDSTRSTGMQHNPPQNPNLQSTDSYSHHLYATLYPNPNPHPPNYGIGMDTGLRPPGIDPYPSVSSFPQSHGGGNEAQQPAVAYAHHQTVDGGAVAVPASYYQDSSATAAAQTWAAAEVVRQYVESIYGTGVTIPQNGTQQFAPTQLSSTLWTNAIVQPRSSVNWKRFPKKTKIVQSAWCEVCKIECNSKDVLDQHKLGKKHQKNLEKLTEAVAPSTGASVVIGPQEKPNKAKAAGLQKTKKAAEPPEDMETKRRKVLEGGAAAEAVRTCAISTPPPRPRPRPPLVVAAVAAPAVPQSPYTPPLDPLLQSTASHLVHPPTQPHLFSPYHNPPLDPYNAHHQQTQYYPCQTHHKKQQQFQQHDRRQQQQQLQQSQHIVTSLLHRIDALESSIRHQIYANPTSFYSVRDAAACTIQTHFRAFLVRRSRTLRQLKDLAFIKSTLNTLKASLSDNTHHDSQTLYHKAIDLLIKLDNIQGGDPMIRDGKRSVSRELIRFIEFIDGVSVKKKELSSRRGKNERWTGTGNKSRVLYSGHRMGNAECGDLDGDERNLMEKLRGRVEKLQGLSRVLEDDDEGDVGLENPNIPNNGRFGFSQNRSGGLVERSGGVQAKVKKSVSFADNGDVSRVFRSSHEPISSGDVNSRDGCGSIDDERELVDNLCKEIEEIGSFAKETEDDDEEGNMEDGGSSQINDGERNPRTAEGNYEIRGQNGNFAFSAPLPVQMESRADLLKKKKAIKIVN